MINAMEEFKTHVGDRIVLCAWVSEFSYDKSSVQKRILKQSYSEHDYQNFLNSISFRYDNGYGIQELDGIIWFTDGTWSTRGEYDGSEWWEDHIRPDVPEKLQQ